MSSCRPEYAARTCRGAKGVERNNKARTPSTLSRFPARPNSRRTHRSARASNRNHYFPSPQARRSEYPRRGSSKRTCHRATSRDASRCTHAGRPARKRAAVLSVATMNIPERIRRPCPVQACPEAAKTLRYARPATTHGEARAVKPAWLRRVSSRRDGTGIQSS